LSSISPACFFTWPWPILKGTIDTGGFLIRVGHIARKLLHEVNVM
jgi:hypothetical protein